MFDSGSLEPLQVYYINYYRLASKINITLEDYDKLTDEAFDTLFSYMLAMELNELKQRASSINPADYSGEDRGKAQRTKASLNRQILDIKDYFRNGQE